MILKQNKLKIILIFLIISLGVSLIVSLLIIDEQKGKLKEYERECKYRFEWSIMDICYGIETIEEGKELEGMALLASGTSKASEFYTLTSYYEMNPMLCGTLAMLNQNITNRNNISEVFKEQDLTILIPALYKERY